VSELTWIVGSAVASALLVVGICGSTGALGFAWLMPASEHRDARRRAFALGAIATLCALAAAVLRAVWQSAALAESPALWMTMLKPVLLESSLGRAMLLQAVAAVVAISGLLIARRVTTFGLIAAACASLALAISPGLGGHPAAQDAPVVAMALSFLHVAGIGLWIGTLGVVTVVAKRLDDAALTVALQRFHALAALGLGSVVLTGVIKLWQISPPLDALLDTAWGFALVAKLFAFTGVAWFGWQHWRDADAALARGERPRMLRSFAREMLVAGCVLVATAVLINSSPPEPTVAQGPPANPDAVATRMYREIASPYCPGMSLASCPSEGAFRLKGRIRAALDSLPSEAVMESLVAEFGEGISARTPTRGLGLFAWLAPFAALVLGALGLTWWLSRATQRVKAPTQDRTAITVGLAGASGDELARLAQALRADD